MAETKDRKAFLRRQRELLEQRKAELSRNVRAELDELQGPDVGDRGHLADLGELAGDADDDDTPFSLMELEGNELEQIDWALQRMDEGAYGECEDCGREIGDARLTALPLATRCIDCERQLEAGRRSA